ncbi:MAG: hypothetical protein PSV13_07560 [Lacunisphaera sp.]|nr:hypothetical protein [Lacunisphaera sp.]
MTRSRHPVWTEQLYAIARQPLEYCPAFPEIAARWERWWNFSAECPLLVAAAPTTEGIYRGKAFHLLDHPAEWLALRRRQLEGTMFVGDSIPRIRVDIGPVAVGAFLGAPLTLSEAEQTSWQHPIITDWQNPPGFGFDPDNPWFKRVITLLKLVADDARGRYLVCTPDLSGAIDVLVNLRGPDQLCLDLHDHRTEVIAASLRVMSAWDHIYTEIMDAVLSRGTGVTQWLACWSNRPFTIPTCDFTALIGPDDFRDCCLPSLRQQAESAGNLLFHLDGPQAARHSPVLQAEPSITAVQYTPGAGTPSALAKLDLLRGLQAAGKPVLVIAPKHEVSRLARVLDRRATAILVEDPLTPAEARELEHAVKSCRA